MVNELFLRRIVQENPSSISNKKFFLAKLFYLAVKLWITPPFLQETRGLMQKNNFRFQILM
jgi:hypothetical protein